MRLVAGHDVQQVFQRLAVQLKASHLFACAVVLRWNATTPAPWIADNALPRVLDMHLTKSLAAEHDKVTILFFASGDILLVGEGLSAAAYHRVHFALEDEAALMGADPSHFSVAAFDLSVDWDAFLTECKDLHAREKNAQPTAPLPTATQGDTPSQPTLAETLDRMLEHAATAFKHRSVSSSRKLALLFVEDEPSIRQLLFALLGDMGHDLYFAANAREAVETYCRNPPHIVFLDINLPDMSGLQILELLKRHDPHVYAVMLTSHAASGPVQTAIGHGAKHYIVKPFSRQKLQDCVARYLAAA